MMCRISDGGYGYEKLVCKSWQSYGKTLTLKDKEKEGNENKDKIGIQEEITCGTGQIQHIERRKFFMNDFHITLHSSEETLLYNAACSILLKFHTQWKDSFQASCVPLF